MTPGGANSGPIDISPHAPTASIALQGTPAATRSPAGLAGSTGGAGAAWRYAGLRPDGQRLRHRLAQYRDRGRQRGRRHDHRHHPEQLGLQEQAQAMPVVWRTILGVLGAAMKKHGIARSRIAGRLAAALLAT